MTYIEFFDAVDAENVCACLSFAPDRVIYIGDDTKTIKDRIPYYEKVFTARGHQIELKAKSVSRSKLDLAVEQLNKIIQMDDEFVFDITGGNEMLMLALGVVYAKNPDKNIQIHWFNLVNNTISDCDKDGKTIYHDVPRLTVAENVQIYGGDVLFGGVQTEKTYRWDLNEDFLADVEKMWEICKSGTHNWNIQMGIFAAANAAGKQSNGGLIVTTTVKEVDDQLDKQKSRLVYRNPDGLIRKLTDANLLTYFDDSDGTNVTVVFKNHQVKRCLTKAGQLLELKMYLAAMNAQNADGTPVYHDGLNGVLIDWNGKKDGNDTKNEIDIMLMHDMIPVFISCKNGYVTADELYKLETVAHRFGSSYAKKALVATALDNLADNGESIRNRAENMGILLIEDVYKCTDEALTEKMAELWYKKVEQKALS